MKSKFKAIGRFAVAFVLTLVLVCSFPSVAFARGMGYTWPNSVSSINFYYVSGSFTTTEVSAIRAAFNTWNAVRNSYNFNYKPMYLSTNSSNNIISKPNVWMYGPTVVGYCDITHNGATITETDIYLNKNLSFSFGASPGCYDLQSIVAHEAGHALGIAHCHELDEQGNPTEVCFTQCPNHVMNPEAKTNYTRRVLQPYDYSSYVVLYPNT